MEAIIYTKTHIQTSMFYCLILPLFCSFVVFFYDFPMSSIGWTDAPDENITHLLYVVINGSSANAYVLRHFNSSSGTQAAIAS